MNAVITKNLSKIYGQDKKAVNGINITLEQGEIYGFLGPNGAGKTTTVKLLTGMLAPSEGCCQIFGTSPAEAPDQVHQLAGVVTEHAQMYDQMTGLENLLFSGNVFGISKNDCRTYAATLLEQLSLSNARDQKLGTYSTGMRQRLSLARALIHRPKILFLDEPTSGLDPESAMNVNNLIKTMAQEEGTTIFLCTHQLRYAQEICNTYGLIDDGILLASGDIKKLRSQVFSGMTVTLSADRFTGNYSYKQLDERTAEIEVTSEKEIPQIVKSVVEKGGNIYHVSARRMSLEEIYFALLEKQKERKEELR